jgi:hypothetical protein
MKGCKASPGGFGWPGLVLLEGSRLPDITCCARLVDAEAGSVVSAVPMPWSGELDYNEVVREESRGYSVGREGYFFFDSSERRLYPPRGLL